MEQIVSCVIHCKSAVKKKKKSKFADLILQTFSIRFTTLIKQSFFYAFFLSLYLYHPNLFLIMTLFSLKRKKNKVIARLHSCKIQHLNEHFWKKNGPTFFPGKMKSIYSWTWQCCSHKMTHFFLGILQFKPYFNNSHKSQAFW